MKVELFDYTPDPEAKIATAAAICYDADTGPDALQRRIKSLMSMRHLATLRFAYATFHVRDVSRVCSHQLVRHPHLSYLQRSQRYCKEEESEIVVPTSFSRSDEIAYAAAIAKAKEVYAQLLRNGVPKGDARFVLPQGCETSMYITGNFQAWYDFLLRRLEKKAQWEVREVAFLIHDYLLNLAPNIFGTQELKSARGE